MKEDFFFFNFNCQGFYSFGGKCIKIYLIVKGQYQMCS